MDVFLGPTSGCSVPLQPPRLKDKADDSREETRKSQDLRRERQTDRESRESCSPCSFLHSGSGQLSYHTEETQL